jgi:hypothetical protein
MEETLTNTRKKALPLKTRVFLKGEGCYDPILHG